MSTAVYEFPLNEKVRNYLRIEHILSQIKASADRNDSTANIQFFNDLFTLLDLLERLDVRNDVLKDFDVQERNLLHWSKHPNIDDEALQQTLQTILRLREGLKQFKRIGNDLKDNAFIASIRQRFAIPGGTCSFDLPNLHFWMSQTPQKRQADQQKWLSSLALIDSAISLSLSFLRQRGVFQSEEAVKGFFPGLSDDKGELIRIRMQSDLSIYPTLSGNKYRYALRFMQFDADTGNNKPVEHTLNFEIASC